MTREKDPVRAMTNSGAPRRKFRDLSSTYAMTKWHTFVSFVPDSWSRFLRKRTAVCQRQLMSELCDDCALLIDFTLIHVINDAEISNERAINITVINKAPHKKRYLPQIRPKYKTTTEKNEYKIDTKRYLENLNQLTQIGVIIPILYYKSLLDI